MRTAFQGWPGVPPIGKAFLLDLKGIRRNLRVEEGCDRESNKNSLVFKGKCEIVP